VAWHIQYNNNTVGPIEHFVVCHSTAMNNDRYE